MMATSLSLVDQGVRTVSQGDRFRVKAYIELHSGVTAPKQSAKSL